MDGQLSKWQGHAAILAVNLIFGFNSPLAKIIVPEWIAPGAFTLVRMVFATVVFWIIAAFHPEEWVTPRDKGIIFIGGLLGLVAVQYSFAEALRFTSPVHITLIAALAPIVVMLLAAVLLHEPISLMKAGGVALGVGGVVLLIFPNLSAPSAATVKGDLLCFVNITSYAIYLVVTRDVTQRYTSLTLMKWMFLFSALCTLPLGAGDLLSSPIFSTAAGAKRLLCLVYICVFATGLAYFLIPVGLKRLRPTTVSMYSNLQPLVASCIAICLGQDTFSWDKAAATALVLAGVALVTQSRAATPPSATSSSIFRHHLSRRPD